MSDIYKKPPGMIRSGLDSNSDRRSRLEGGGRRGFGCRHGKDGKTTLRRPAMAGRLGGIVHGQTSMIHPGASTGPKRRLGGRQAVKFGADIGHAPGNDHPARAAVC